MLRYYPISSGLQTRVSDIHFNRSLCELKNAFPVSVQSPGRLWQRSESEFTFNPANLQGQQVETPVYKREVTILGHTSSLFCTIEHRTTASLSYTLHSMIIQISIYLFSLSEPWHHFPFFGAECAAYWTESKCDPYLDCVPLLHITMYLRHNQTVLDKQEAFIF